MKFRNLFAFAIALGFSLSANAGVTVTDAWARATAPGQTTGAAYLTIKSDGAAKLVGASTPAAKSAQLHEMKTQDNMMKMRPVDSIDLPAGKAVKLSGDYHIMLMDIIQPLKSGATFPLTLNILGADNKHQSVDVKIQVRDAMPMPKRDDMKDMDGMSGMKGM